jgi:hypothetical protein
MSFNQSTPRPRTRTTASRGKATRVWTSIRSTARSPSSTTSTTSSSSRRRRREAVGTSCRPSPSRFAQPTGPQASRRRRRGLGSRSERSLPTACAATRRTPASPPRPSRTPSSAPFSKSTFRGPTARPEADAQRPRNRRARGARCSPRAAAPRQLPSPACTATPTFWRCKKRRSRPSAAPAARQAGTAAKRGRLVGRGQRRGAAGTLPSISSEMRAARQTHGV